MTYSELLFRRPGEEVIYPDDARRLVAAACDGVDIDPGIFARDSTGRTISGLFGATDGSEGIGLPPRIVFDGGKGFIRMYGIGKEGSALLEQQAPKLFTALFSKGFRSFDVKNGQMSIAWQDEGMTPLYAIRCLVVAKKPAQCQQYIRAPLTDELSEQVSDLILRGLTGVARMLDEELMAENKRPIYTGSIPSSVDLLEGTPCPVTIKPGLTAAGYKNLLLAFPCKFQGPWVTGMLRSRGFGLMRAINPTRQD